MFKLTKNRALLLRLFYTNPDCSFYIQEIGRILGKKPGVFQRTLNNLENEGILKSELKGRAKYFTANKDHPLYKEIKSIVFKTIGIVGSIKQILKKTSNVKLAFIYGSFPKGREHSFSDIDLIIVGKPDEDVIIEELDALESKIRREINYKLYKTENFLKLVKQKDPFLLEILHDKKTFVIGDDNEVGKILGE